MGTGQNDGIHPLGKQQLQILLFRLRQVAAAAEEGIVSAAAQLLLQIVDGAGQPGIGGIRAHDADGAHGVKP